jgi:hypothetical protein
MSWLDVVPTLARRAVLAADRLALSLSTGRIATQIRRLFTSGEAAQDQATSRWFDLILDDRSTTGRVDPRVVAAARAQGHFVPR